MQFEHRLAVGFLQILQLFLVLLTKILRIGSKRVLYASFTIIDPLLDLRRRLGWPQSLSSYLE